MALSTQIASRAPVPAPALTARPVSGRTPVTIRTRPAYTKTGSPPEVTSAPGSTSRARRAALMPASLPPIATIRMTGYLPSLATRFRSGACAVVRAVRDDDLRGLVGGQRGVEELNDEHACAGAVEELRHQ